MKVTDLDQEIEKKIINDREKDYGNYQENFTLLAEMFKADNYIDLSIYNKMTKEVHKKEVAKKDKI
jgi:hypothetical protein